MRGFLLAVFATGHRLSRWRRRHFTDAGGVVLTAIGMAGALSVGASGSRLDLIVLVGIALLLVASPTAFWFRRSARHLTIERKLPRTAVCGVPFTYELVVSNRGRHVLPALTLRDQPPEIFPDKERFSGGREPDEASRNWFDRQVGFFRWLWLLDHARGLDNEPVTVSVPANGVASARVQATPLRRGLVRFGPVELARPDPLGLLYGLVRRSVPESLIVFPRCHPMRPLPLAGAHRLQTGGAHRPQSVGQTEEFLYLRDFRRGDSRRHIHWRSSARRGALVVKQHQDERHQRHALVVDSFTRPGQEQVFEDAVEVAASVVGTVRLGDAMLDLMFLGGHAHVVTAGRGSAGIETLLEILACVPPCPDRPFSELSQLVRRHAAGLTACLFVFLVWDQDRQELVRDIRSQGKPVQVIVMTTGDQAPMAPGVLADAPGRLHPVPVGHVAATLATLDLSGPPDGKAVA